MKKLLLVALVLTYFVSYSQERKSSIDKLPDGWYQTYGVGKSELSSITIKSKEWVYVSNGSITSVGTDNKARNITNALQKSFEGSNLKKSYITYLSGGGLKSRTFKNKEFLIAKITYDISTKILFQKTRILYYSIKL